MDLIVYYRKEFWNDCIGEEAVMYYGVPIKTYRINFDRYFMQLLEKAENKQALEQVKQSFIDTIKGIDLIIEELRKTRDKVEHTQVAGIF